MYEERTFNMQGLRAASSAQQTSMQSAAKVRFPPDLRALRKQSELIAGREEIGE